MEVNRIKMSLKKRKETESLIKLRKLHKREKEKRNYYKNGDLYNMDKIEKYYARKRHRESNYS